MAIFSSLSLKQPWHTSAPDSRLDLEFTPVIERVAQTNLLLIAGEVHQMLGGYCGMVMADAVEVDHLDGLIGLAEVPHMR